MKAVVVYEPGGPDKLIYTDVPTPEVKPGWSLVRIKGFGINHSEIFTRRGDSPSVRFPRILGIECVGTVAKSTSDHLKEGQMVASMMGEMGRAFDGGYAEYALLPNKQIYPIRSHLSWEEIAAVPETYYTAFKAYSNLLIQETDHILVRGGTSGVGTSFLKLVRGKYPDIKITGTSRRESKIPLMKEIGFDDVVIDKNNHLETYETYTKVLELIGPASVKDSLKHLERHGIVCSCGQLGNQWYLEEFDPIMELHNDTYLTTAYSDEVDGGQLQELFDYIEKYKVDVRPEKVFSLKDTPKAHEYLESSHSFGKVVVMN